MSVSKRIDDRQRMRMVLNSAMCAKQARRRKTGRLSQQPLNRKTLRAVRIRLGTFFQKKKEKTKEKCHARLPTRVPASSVSRVSRCQANRTGNIEKTIAEVTMGTRTCEGAKTVPKKVQRLNLEPSKYSENSAARHFLFAKNCARRGWHHGRTDLEANWYLRERSILGNRGKWRPVRTTRTKWVRLMDGSKNFITSEHGVNRRRLRPWTVYELVTTCPGQYIDSGHVLPRGCESDSIFVWTVPGPGSTHPYAEVHHS